MIRTDMRDFLYSIVLLAFCFFSSTISAQYRNYSNDTIMCVQSCMEKCLKDLSELKEDIQTYEDISPNIEDKIQYIENDFNKYYDDYRLLIDNYNLEKFNQIIIIILIILERVSS